jgi:hypothetical protein
MNKKRRLLKNALGSNAFWQVNKQLYNQLGWRPTLLLTHLIDLLDNYENMPDEFYQQYTRLKDSLKFSRKDLDYSFKILKEKELIAVELKGVPAKNHYTLNEDNILNIMILEQTSSLLEDELDSSLGADKYKEKEREKKESTPAAAGGANFTNPNAQASEHMVNSLANWKELTTLWKTEESSAILKAIFKKYFLPLGREEQESILKMIKEFGSDVQYLRNTWIGQAFKQDLMNKESLQEDIQKRKGFSKPKNAMPQSTGKFTKENIFK